MKMLLLLMIMTTTVDATANTIDLETIEITIEQSVEAYPIQDQIDDEQLAEIEAIIE